MNHSKQSILILYTGGTIGMVTNPTDHSLRPLDFEYITKEIPELKKFSHHLVWKSLNPLVDSSNIQPDNWKRIAETIYSLYDKYDGFVILHGTDTMAFSSSALSFMLKNLDKPVIFTGSQLPIGLVRTDGRDNLIAAIEVATYSEKGLPMVPGVSVFFENKLFKGNRITKYSAENFNAYASPNYPILAKTGVHLQFNKKYISSPPEKNKLELHTALDCSVGIFKIFPGMSQEWVQSLFKVPHLKAIILETFGSGNAPTDNWFIDIIEDFISKGGIVLNVTQCLSGKVDQGRYETSLKLRKANVIGGSDITTEAAVTKLMFLLGKKLTDKKLHFELNNAICGEFS